MMESIGPKASTNVAKRIITTMQFSVYVFFSRSFVFLMLGITSKSKEVEVKKRNEKEKHRTEMVNGLRASHSHIPLRDNNEDDKRNDLKPNLLCFFFLFSFTL